MQVLITRALTDVSVHHLGTVFAHCLQVVDLALQEGHLRFQVFLLQVARAPHSRSHGERVRRSQKGGECARETQRLSRRKSREREGGEGLTDSFLPMDLLWERERVMLKKDSFLLVDGGGDEALTSLPREEGGGGEEADWPRPPDRLSMLGELLAVLELWPEKAEARGHWK